MDNETQSKSSEPVATMPSLRIKDHKGRVIAIFRQGKPILFSRFPDSKDKEIKSVISFTRRILQKRNIQESIIEQELTAAEDFLRFKAVEDEFCS